LRTQGPRDDDDPFDLALLGARRGAGAITILTAPVGDDTTPRLDAAARVAVANGMLVARARGRLSERALPFGAAVELFEVPWTSDLDEDDRARLSDGPARAAAALLEGVSRGAQGGEDAGFGVIRGLAALARQLADRSTGGDGSGSRGLALIVDDLHDLDALSLRFLAYLAGRLDAAPIALLGALRPGLPAEDAQALDALLAAARVVRPPSLTPPEVVALTRAALPSASPRFCAACAGASAGSPGLLAQLLAECVRRRLAATDAQLERVAQIVPEAIRGGVIAHLARLPEPAQALARAVAGLGDPITLPQAASAARLDEAAASAALDSLVAAGILAPQLPLRYVAPLVRRAVDSSLTVGQRIALGRGAPGQPPRIRSAGPASAGLGSLTPSERRVAELAARGRTTREIAATLFVTPKTVEFHLRNVYRKLDVPSSRSELTRVLATVLGAGDPPPPEERA
jgi:DNA-binding CsgD family transcriptional regulator